MGNFTNRTPLFARYQPGGVFSIVDETKTTGNIWFVDSGGSGVDASGCGVNPDKPFATIDYAIAQCTPSNGDRIYVMPGHVEDLGSGETIDFDVAGIEVIGLGSGASRPRIDLNHASASVDVGKNDVLIRNLVIQPSESAILIGIDIETGITGTVIEDCELAVGEDGAGVDEFVKAIHLTSGNHDTVIRNTKILAHASAANATHGIHVDAASNRLTLDGVVIDGPYATAGILEDAAGVNHVVRNCSIEVTGANYGFYNATPATASTFAERSNNVNDQERTPGGGYIWYVDSEAGSDAHDGFSIKGAKATIAAARTLNSATISWELTNYPQNEIRVLPGVYAETVGGLYYCTLKGYGPMGGQTLVQHATASAMVASQMINSRVENIKFLCNTQNVPVIDLGIVNYVEFANCVFAIGGDVSGVAGIDTENSQNLTVRNCSFESLQGGNQLAYGIYARGGADKYFALALIEGNRINAATAGIYIADNCTASLTVIKDNVISRPVTGIYDGSANTYCINNWITATTDAINHAASGTQCIANHVINNAVAAVEVAGTD